MIKKVRIRNPSTAKSDHLATLNMHFYLSVKSLQNVKFGKQLYIIGFNKMVSILSFMGL